VAFYQYDIGSTNPPALTAAGDTRMIHYIISFQLTAPFTAAGPAAGFVTSRLLATFSFSLSAVSASSKKKGVENLRIFFLDRH